jgi:hypothetical protein
MTARAFKSENNRCRLEWTPAPWRPLQDYGRLLPEGGSSYLALLRNHDEVAQLAPLDSIGSHSTPSGVRITVVKSER